jgi:outer membrane biosynthesis protein TonB
MRIATSALMTLALCLSANVQAQGLDDMLDSIPEIETDEDEAAKLAAAEAAKEAAADPLAEDSLPVFTKRCRAHVLALFEVPKSVAKKAPSSSSRVLVKLYGDGSYMALAPVQMSGDKKFDKAVIKALRSAEPLPKPPVSLRNDMAQGIVIEFKAQ